MRKTKVFLILAIVMMLWGCIVKVQANSFNFDVTVKNTEVNEGDTLKVDMKVTEITAKEGINVLEANLKYDNSIFESVIFEDANGWETTYNAESGKFVAVKLVEGVTKEEKIGQIQLKLKENIDKKETQIEINEITSNDGESLIKQGNTIIKIKITDKDQDQNQNGNGNQNNNTNQNGNGNQNNNNNQIGNGSGNQNNNINQSGNGNQNNNSNQNGNTNQNKDNNKKPSTITGDNIKTQDKIVYMIIIAIMLILINLVYCIVKYKKLEGEGKYRRGIIISIVMLIVLMAAIIILSKDVIALSEETIEEQIERLQKENEDNPESTEYLITDETISRIKPGTTVGKLKSKLENVTVSENVDLDTEEQTTKLDDKAIIKTGMKVKYEENEREYEISVIGDINKDGILNQIELTKIIRKILNNAKWGIEEQIEKMAADINYDGNIDIKDIQNIIHYILYEKLEEEIEDIEKEIEIVESPKIEIEKGKDIEKGTNISKVIVRIEEQNEKTKTEKTIYKIAGTKETEEKEIKEVEEIELTEPGVYKITSYTYGKQGNKSKGTSKIIIIEEAPEIQINTKEYTKENIKVTLGKREGHETQYQINDGQWKKYEEPFDVEENCTIKTRLTDGENEEEGFLRELEITNIDKEKPTGKIEVTGKGTSKITVNLEGKDDLSGIKEIRIYAKEKGTEKYVSKKYTYEDDEEKNSIKKESLIIKGLKAETEYEIYIEVEDRVGNILNKDNSEKEEYEDISIMETTEETATPIILISPIQWTNGKIESIITEEEGYDREYKIDNGEWTKYAGKIEIEENCIISARLIEKENRENISKEVTKEITNIDKTEPIGNIERIEVNKNDITIKVTGQDEELSGVHTIKLYLKEGTGKYNCIKTYTYSGEDNYLKEEIYKITGLKPETTYSIYVEIEDYAGNIYSTKNNNELEIKTLEEPYLTIDVIPSEWTNQKVTATIKMPEGYKEQGYEVEYKVDNSQWTKYTEKIETEKNCIITARIKKEENIIKEQTKEITNIDKLTPETFTPMAISTTNNIILTGFTQDTEANKENGKSGIEKYYFSKDNGITWEPENGQANSSYNFTGLTQNTTYKLKMKAVDKAGNETITSTINKTTETVPGLSTGEGEEGKGNITFTKKPNKWTNGNVTVEANTTEEGYTLQTSKNGETWTTETSQEYTENGTIYARLTDGQNNGKIATEAINNIDKEKPTITELKATTNNITIKATDEASGIVGYAITTENQKPEETSFTEVENTKELETTITGKTQNTTYYIWVKDEAGNISESKVVKTITVPDLVEGQVTFTYNPDKWTNKNVIVTAGTEIEGYTIQTSKDGTTWENKTSQEYTQNGTMYARLYDGTNYGGTVSATIDKIDKEKPIVTETSTTTNSITIKATEEASGIVGYAITTNATIPTEFTSCTNTKTFNTTVTGKAQNTTYYIWVKDEAGNISESKTAKTGTMLDLTTGENGNVTFTYSTEEWTNGTVTATASTEIEGYTIQTSKNGTTWENTESQEYTENGTIYARLWDGTNYGGTASATVDNIDKTKPIVTGVTVTTNSIKIKATDEASGIIGYAITTENQEPNQTNFIAVENTKTLDTVSTGKTQETTYYVWVKDEAGNISASKSTTTEAMPDLTERDVTFTYNPNGWTNQKITVTANTTIEGYILQTSKDNLAWTSTSSQEFIENGTMYVRLFDGTNYGGAVSATVDKIDKIKPIITSATATTNSIQITATDEASGIMGYAITTENQEPNETSFVAVENTKTLTTVATGKTQGTTYYVWVKDEAGNISASKSTTTGAVPDLTERDVTFTYSTRCWTNEKITVTASTDVEGYAIQTSKDGKTWTNTESQEFTVNGTIYARLWDGTNYGGVASATVDKIDTTKPTISAELSSTNQTSNSITLNMNVQDTSSGISKIIWYYRAPESTTSSNTTDEYAEMNGTTVGSVTEETKEKTISNLASGITYSIYAVVYDVAGNSTTSNTINISTKSIPDLVTGEEGQEGNVTFTYSTEEWTNGTVIATASTTITEYTLQTSKDRENWSTATSQTFTENGTIYARLYDGINYGGIASGNINNIDKTAPIVTAAITTTNSIIITATDEANGSGIIGYAITTSTTVPTSFTSVANTKSLSTTVTGKTQNTTYYVWVKDEAGNISASKTAKTGTVPELIKDTNVTFDYSTNEWTKENVTVTATTTVTGYTLQTRTENTDWGSATSQTFTENGTMYVRLYDGTNYGGTASATVDKIDKTGPSITNSARTRRWYTLFL